jgi:hypothetical protein
LSTATDEGVRTSTSVDPDDPDGSRRRMFVRRIVCALKARVSRDEAPTGGESGNGTHDTQASLTTPQYERIKELEESTMKHEGKDAPNPQSIPDFFAPLERGVDWVSGPADPIESDTDPRSVGEVVSDIDNLPPEVQDLLRALRDQSS